MQSFNATLFTILLILAPVALIKGDESASAAPVDVPVELTTALAPVEILTSVAPEAPEVPDIAETVAAPQSTEAPAPATEAPATEAPATEAPETEAPAVEQTEVVAEVTAPAAEVITPEVPSVVESTAAPVEAETPVVVVVEEHTEAQEEVTSRPMLSSSEGSVEDTSSFEDLLDSTDNSTSVAYHTGTFLVAPIVLFALVQ